MLLNLRKRKREKSKPKTNKAGRKGLERLENEVSVNISPSLTTVKIKLMTKITTPSSD
jgi:hypothetical protein